MKALENKTVKFARDREWLQFNTPENLAKSISIEAGKLLKCFQWNNNYNKDELKYEIADVMNYCILLCYQIGVDPRQIILDKMKISEKRLRGLVQNIISYKNLLLYLKKLIKGEINIYEPRR